MKANVLSHIIGAGLISLSLLTACGAAAEPQTKVEPTQAGLSQEAAIPADPADRKFLTPGYGASVGGYEENIAIATVDPADRKFFTPGYGANAGGYGAANRGIDLSTYHQSEWGRSANTDLNIMEQALVVYHQSEWSRWPAHLSLAGLRKLDPADRKFFSPGYGAFPKDQ